MSQSGFTVPDGAIDTALGRFTNWLKAAKLDTKEHQLDGMRFCMERELATTTPYGARGGIIADEMGLGKTILMLGCIVSNFRSETTQRKNTLIVLPPALLEQWIRIFKQFLGHLPLVYHGKKVTDVTAEQLVNASVIVTTYGMIATGRKQACPLWQIPFHRLIMDEAHHVRNMNTRAFCGTMKIKADNKWLVTGTPIQNSNTDLLALCTVLGLKEAFMANRSEIREIIGQHLLRRTKKSVGIKLPPLNQELIEVPWSSPEEENLAKQIHSKARFSGVSVDNVDALINMLTHHPLPMLTRARQSCVFPHLLHKAVHKMKLKGQIPLNINLNKIRTCSKATAIANHIGERKFNGRRKIVFCHYRGEIDLICGLLRKKKISVGTIDGRSKKRDKRNFLEYSITKRQFTNVCKKWRDNEFVFERIKGFLGPDVLVVQIQTACEGLNLQHFQEVYFTSPHWNPAVEDQSIARAHRIGQDEKVNVFRFVMADFRGCTCGNTACKRQAHITLDTYCRMIQDKKRELNSVIDA
jgi:SNF2 family DNA or RNA helicase